MNLEELGYGNWCRDNMEKGCAVLLSVANGELTAERFQSFLKLMKESRYYEMTYLGRKTRRLERWSRTT